MPSLTDAQRWDMVVDQADLIESFARLAHNASRHSYMSQVTRYEDFFQEGNLIAFEAAKTWVPEKGKFRTYLGHKLKWGMFELLHPRRRCHHDRVKNILSLDYQIEEIDEFEAVLPDIDSEFEDEVVNKVAYQEFAASLRPRHAYIFQERLKDRLLQDIGDDLGISESRVSQICSALKPRAKEALIA